MRQLCFSPFELPELVGEAVSFIRENDPPEGYAVAFSGGKDSIVTLELARMAGVKYNAHFNCTGIEPPELTRFIRKNYPEVRIVRPARTFWDGVRKNGPPTIFRRWCCRELKESNGTAGQTMLFGIRAEESLKRARRGRISEQKVRGGVIHQLKPIFSWPEWAVWEFIKQRGLEYPTLYDEGYSRLGCIPCPYSVIGGGKTVAIRRAESMRRWPHVWRAFEKSVKDYWKEKKAQGLTLYSTSDGAFWEEYLQGFPKKRGKG